MLEDINLEVYNKLPDQDLSLIPVPGGTTHIVPYVPYFIVVRSTILESSIVGQMQISLRPVFQYYLVVPSSLASTFQTSNFSTRAPRLRSVDLLQIACS